MYLSKLEIQGFKSFAEKAVLEFNHDLTAIVGPNGTGKSNITDAVRWVLGEQSLKMLRGKKSEDVIFAGSKKRSRLGFAEVSLYLNNEDGRAPLDYREIVITRRLYRDGEGEYLINKQKVRLADIQLLLAKANFGQRTYSIIGQGMIDSILTTSPQERKEFFDEATGVREYQIKKDQAILKLERSQENLTQSEQLLQEIGPRLRSLARQVKRLEHKEETVKKLQALQDKYYNKLLTDLNNQHQEINQQLSKIEKGGSELEAKILESQKQIDEPETSDTQAQSFQKLQDDYQALSVERNQLTQELSVIQGKIDLDLTKAGQLDLVWLRNKKTEIDNQLKSVEQKTSTSRKEAEKRQEVLNGKLDEQKKVLAEFNALQEKLLKTQQTSSHPKTVSLVKIKQHLNELYQKQSDFIDLLEKAKGLAEVKKLKNRANNLLQEIKWLASKLAAVADETDEDLMAWQKKLNDFLNQKDSLVNEILELKIKLEVAGQKGEQFREEQEKLIGEQKKITAELSAYNGEGNSALEEQKKEAGEKIKELDKKLAKLKKELAQFSQKQASEKNRFIELQRGLRDLQGQLNTQSANINDLKIQQAKIETKKEDLEKEISIEYQGSFQPREFSELINIEEAQAEISRLKNQLAIIGGIDDEIVDEHKEVKERHTFLSEQSTDLKNAMASCHEIIKELDEKITKQFEEAFKKINDNFQHYFKILFTGGSAKLILEKRWVVEQVEENLSPENMAEESEEIKTEDPCLPAGREDRRPKTEEEKNKKYEFIIEIKATPPGKKLKSLNMLSGGEKALTAIALISAIMAANPSPFVVLDEVDAALDEANSIRFAKIIEDLSFKTQFVCITHNRATMHQAAILYGVTMGDDGVSKLLSINLAEAEKVAE